MSAPLHSVSNTLQRLAPKHKVGAEPGHVLTCIDKDGAIAWQDPISGATGDVSPDLVITEEVTATSGLFIVNPAEDWRKLIVTNGGLGVSSIITQIDDPTALSVGREYEIVNRTPLALQVFTDSGGNDFHFSGSPNNSAIVASGGSALFTLTSGDAGVGAYTVTHGMTNAVGNNARSFNDTAVAVGASATANGASSVALGPGANTSIDSVVGFSSNLVLNAVNGNFLQVQIPGEANAQYVHIIPTVGRSVASFFDNGTVTSITGETLASGTDLNFDDAVGPEALNFSTITPAIVGAGTTGPNPGMLTGRRTFATFGGKDNDSMHVIVYNTGEFEIKVLAAGTFSFDVDWPGGSLGAGPKLFRGVYHASIFGQGFDAGLTIPLQILLATGTNNLRFFGEVPAGSPLIGDDHQVKFNFETIMEIDYN